MYTAARESAREDRTDPAIGAIPVAPHRRRRLSLALIAAATAVYFSGALLWAWKTSLGVDEVFVMWVLRFFPASGVVPALSSGADSLPPGYYWLLQGLSGVFGLSPLVLRLPSIAAFYVFLAATYFVCRQRAGMLTSALAAALVCLTGAARAATMARPYAIVCACFGAAVLVWLRPAGFRRPAWLAGALVSGVFVHFYAVLLAVSAGFMEILWSMREHTIRWRNWIAVFVGGLSVLMWWPVIGPIYRTTHASTSAPGFYARPSIAALGLKYASMIFTGEVSVLIALLIAIAVVCSAAVRERTSAKPQASLPRLAGDFDVALFVAAVLPVVTFLFALVVTGSFNTRYFFAAAMVPGMFVSRIIGRRKFSERVSACLLVLAVAFFAANVRSALTAHDPRLDAAGRAPGSLPIVLGDASDFFVLAESAPKTVRDRLVFVGMPQGARSPDPEPELVANKWKKLRPELAVFSAEQFFPGRCSFYALDTRSAREGMTGWLRRNRIVSVESETGIVRLLKVETPGCAADGPWSGL